MIPILHTVHVTYIKYSRTNLLFYSWLTFLWLKPLLRILLDGENFLHQWMNEWSGFPLLGFFFKLPLMRIRLAALCLDLFPIPTPICCQGDVWICMELMDTSLDKFYKQVIEKGLTIPEDILGKIAVSVGYFTSSITWIHASDICYVTLSCLLMTSVITDSKGSGASAQQSASHPQR